MFWKGCPYANKENTQAKLLHKSKHVKEIKINTMTFLLTIAARKHTFQEQETFNCYIAAGESQSDPGLLYNNVRAN